MRAQRSPLRMRSNASTFPIASFTGLSLQKALDVAKGDVGVVAHVRPEEILQSESEPAGNEDYDTNSPVGRSHVLPSYGTHRPRDQREGGCPAQISSICTGGR